MDLSQDVTTRLWMAGVGVAGFLIVYWWRRRTRPVSLELSQSSQQLTHLVETADKPTADEIAEVLTKGSRVLRDD